MVVRLRRPREIEIHFGERNLLGDEPRRHAVHELEHQFAAEHADGGAARIRHHLHVAQRAFALRLQAEIVEDQMEELAETMQRDLELRCVEQAQAQVFQRAVA